MLVLVSVTPEDVAFALKHVGVVYALYTIFNPIVVQFFVNVTKYTNNAGND